MIRTQSFAGIVVAAEAWADAAEASAGTATTKAAEANASADEAESWANVAATAYTPKYIFDTLAELQGVTTADDGDVGLVRDDTDTANNGVWRWNDGGSVWEFAGEDTGLRVLALEAGFGVCPVGVAATGNTLVVRNGAGFIVSILSRAAVATLMNNRQWIEDTAKRIVLRPTGGAFLKRNLDGFILTNYDAPVASSAATEETDTAAHVAAALGDQVEDAPLIAGKNNFFWVGDSKSEGNNYTDDVYVQIAGSLPAGATVTSNANNYNGHSLTALIGVIDDIRTYIDATIFGTGTAEAISMLFVSAQANDFIDGTSADEWERLTDEWLTLLLRKCSQAYVGTDPSVPVPVPPVFAAGDCSFAYGGYSSAILLRALEKSRRDFRYGLIGPDYIMPYDPADYRHYDSPVGQRRISAFAAVAAKEWRVNRKKFHPTQAVEAYLQDGKLYIRCEMPHAPLQISTYWCSAISQHGLVAYDATNTEVALSSIGIVGGGRIIECTPASDLAGGRITAGLVGSTPNTSGPVNGPRTTFIDSSPETYTDPDDGLVNLYNALYPFSIPLAAE